MPIKIQFLARPEYVDLKAFHPKPIKVNIPQWFKELEHTKEKRTIKGCIPFLDSLTSGYSLYTPQDISIEHNMHNEKTGERDSFSKFSYEALKDWVNSMGLNLNTNNGDVHPINQVGDKCPFAHENKHLPFYKILNPWIIKTPPGYSCLFTTPLNNSDDRFFTLSGIVDTDTYTLPVNFPIVLNGDKYPSLNTLIKAGTPYVQVIPFKRDEWQMEIGYTKQDPHITVLSLSRWFIHQYKNIFWKKKSWK